MATRVPVAAPPATPPRVSLLNSVQVVENNERWHAGVVWTPEACAEGGAMAADCDLTPERNAPATPDAVASSPFYVWAADECSTFGFQARDWQARARRQLEATQSFQIARELWTGAITKGSAAPGDESPYLADDNTEVVGESPESPRLAIARLEAMAMRCMRGGRVMLHMSPMVFAMVTQEARSPYIQLTGNVATTALGNILVTDAGYTGQQPDSVGDVDQSEWIYATPPVQVRMDAVEVLPGSLDDARNMAMALDRPVNTATVWAQRLVLYQLESCCRFAMQTDIARSLSQAFN